MRLGGLCRSPPNTQCHKQRRIEGGSNWITVLYICHEPNNHIYLSLSPIWRPGQVFRNALLNLRPSHSLSVHLSLQHHLGIREMNGCFSASRGVILFSGLSAKHRSNKSMKRFNSFVSTSVNPFDADIRRVRRSRDALRPFKVLMISYLCLMLAWRLLILSSDGRKRMWD